MSALSNSWIEQLIDSVGSLAHQRIELKDTILLLKKRTEILEEIARQADLVRRLQKTYFGSRTPSALEEAKSAERKLDQLLKDLDKPPVQQQALGI